GAGEQALVARALVALERLEAVAAHAVVELHAPARTAARLDHELVLETADLRLLVGRALHAGLPVEAALAGLVGGEVAEGRRGVRRLDAAVGAGARLGREAAGVADEHGVLVGAGARA